MAYTRFGGGLGISPCGRTECGNAQSVIEPRFLTSVPADKQLTAPLNSELRFVTYCFSSWIDIADITIEISEDDEVTWLPAFDGENFISPYSGPHSKVLRDGHSVIFYIQKLAPWPVNQRVVVRFSGSDEFNQQASKEAPVVW